MNPLPMRWAEVFLDLAELGLHNSVAIDSWVGGQGGRLRARYYHRTRCAVSMADCLAAVVARERAVPLATSDSHLLDVCHAESIDVIVLPRSNGTRWAPST
jgi:predicted nucleic acid-binding protein